MLIQRFFFVFGWCYFFIWIIRDFYLHVVVYHVIFLCKFYALYCYLYWNKMINDYIFKWTHFLYFLGLIVMGVPLIPSMHHIRRQVWGMVPNKLLGHSHFSWFNLFLIPLRLILLGHWRSSMFHNVWNGGSTLVLLDLLLVGVLVF